MNTQFYVLLIILIVSYTFVPFLKKESSRDFTKEEYFIIYNFASFVLIIVFAILIFKNNSHKELMSKLNTKNVCFCMVTALASLIGSYVLLQLIKSHDVSFIMPHVQPLVLVLTLVCGYVMFREHLTVKKVIGIGLILGGIFVLNRV